MRQTNKRTRLLAQAGSDKSDGPIGNHANEGLPLDHSTPARTWAVGATQHRRLSATIVNARVKATGLHTATDEFVAGLTPDRHGNLTREEAAELRRLATEHCQTDGGYNSLPIAWGYCPDGREWNAVFLGKRAAVRFFGRRRELMS